MTTLWRHIEDRTARYAALPLFVAFRQDRIPPDRFADFLREQAMTARWFQDVVRAATEIPAGPYAAFAARHRATDSGLDRWLPGDLARFGLPPMAEDDWFRAEWLPARIQMARILGRCHGALPEERLVILACMEAAGAVALGTLRDYVARHGFGGPTSDPGSTHLGIEARQTERIRAAMGALSYSGLTALHDVVDLVFDALSTMLSDRARGHDTEHLEEAS